MTNPATATGPQTEPPTESTDQTIDVFQAAAWFDDLWNSTARAISTSMLEWRCRTWGSGRGRAHWEDVAQFSIIVARFNLATDTDDEARDELIVQVPLDKVRAIQRTLDKIGTMPDEWPWCDEDIIDDTDAQIACAATTLDMTAEALATNDELLEAVRIRR